MRARALGSFLGGITAIICGNLLGYWIDRVNIPLKTRTRYGFGVILTLQGALWTWATVMVAEYTRTRPNLDWSDEGFGRGFGVFLLLTMGFQMNYMFL